MTKENRMDRLQDKLNARVARIGGRISQINKNTNPYRMEKISDEERIYDYAQLSDEDINFARQNFPPEVVSEYFGKMEELLRRKNA